MSRAPGTHRCLFTGIKVQYLDRLADGEKTFFTKDARGARGPFFSRLLGADQGSRDTLLTRPHEPHQDARHW